jgi:hypothetical protein
MDQANLPHEVPAETGTSVLIRDGAHQGTVVVNLGHKGFAFHHLDNMQEDGIRPRCVLLHLAEPVMKYDAGYLVEVSDWQSALPNSALVGCDLDGEGYALLGIEDGTEIDARCGTILWDSAAERD